jgi:WD40 repeat protein
LQVLRLLAYAALIAFCDGLGVAVLLGAQDTSETERLVRQLESSQFKVRQAATKALDALGEPALPALRKALAAARDPEARRRLQQVIDGIEGRLYREVACFRGHGDDSIYSQIYSVAFSPDGRLALSGGQDGTVRLWSLTTRKGVRRFEAGWMQVSTADFSPDGRRILAGSFDGRVRVWDAKTYLPRSTFRGHEVSVRAMAWGDGGRLLLCGGGDPIKKDFSLWLCDGASGRRLRRLVGHTRCVHCVALSPDGRRALSCSNQTMRLWDVTSGKEIRRFRSEGLNSLNIACSPDWSFALVGELDGSLWLWDLRTWKKVRQFKGHAESVNGVAFSPDGRRAISGGGSAYLIPGMLPEDCRLRLWDVATGQLLYCFPNTGLAIECVAFSPDGRFALSGHADGAVRLWRLPKGQGEES